jgi:hypothetical protein
MDGSAPTGRVLTVKGAPIIELKGEKIASDHCLFTGERWMSSLDVRHTKSSIIEANIAAYNDELNEVEKASTFLDTISARIEAAMKLTNKDKQSLLYEPVLRIRSASRRQFEYRAHLCLQVGQIPLV